MTDVLQQFRQIIVIHGRILGKAAFQLGEEAQAETAYRKAIGVNPNALLAWKGLAEIYASRTADFTGSVEANEKLVRIWPCCLSSSIAVQALHRTTGSAIHVFKPWPDQL